MTESIKICLNMIVKNEAAVILRCLKSLYQHIDAWVIADTGSTDETPALIQKFMEEKKIPGRLVHHRWQNFGHNRNLALQATQEFECDYILFVDADEELKFSPEFDKQALTAPGYIFQVIFHYIFPRFQLIKANCGWRWIGVCHETLRSPETKTVLFLPTITTYPRTDGHRAKDPHRFHRDALAFETALLEMEDQTFEAWNDVYPRSLYYRAQSYRDAKMKEEATVAFKAHLDFESHSEMAYLSYYFLAQYRAEEGRPLSAWIMYILKAQQICPSRVEAWQLLGQNVQDPKDAELVFNLMRPFLKRQMTTSCTFHIDPKVYNFAFHYTVALTAMKAQLWRSALPLFRSVLRKPSLPLNLREASLKYITLCEQKCQGPIFLVGFGSAMIKTLAEKAGLPVLDLTQEATQYLHGTLTLENYCQLIPDQKTCLVYAPQQLWWLKALQPRFPSARLLVCQQSARYLTHLDSESTWFHEQDWDKITPSLRTQIFGRTQAQSKEQRLTARILAYAQAVQKVHPDFIFQYEDWVLQPEEQEEALEDFLGQPLDWSSVTRLPTLQGL